MPAPIVVLYGPTGVGKTQVAIELCRRLGGEIIGADSVQVYRGLDIGSGKPNAAELRGVRHHMLDLIEPDQSIDAARYAQLADAAIAQTRAHGKLPFVVGGTGLWLRALLRGLVDAPQVAPALRARLEADFREQGPSAMHARLREVDPITAARVHPNDQLRIVRALEVHAQTGVALGALRQAHSHGQPRYRALFIVLDVPEPHYTQRIEARVHGMLEHGFVDEVEALIARYGAEVRALGSVGYRQVIEHLRDGVPLDETERKIVQATRLYARRQRTWAKSEPDVSLRMVPADALSDETIARIETLFASTSAPPLM